MHYSFHKQHPHRVTLAHQDIATKYLLTVFLMTFIILRLEESLEFLETDTRSAKFAKVAVKRGNYWETVHSAICTYPAFTLP